MTPDNVHTKLPPHSKTTTAQFYRLDRLVCPAISLERASKDAAHIQSDASIKHPATRLRVEVHTTRKRSDEAAVAQQLARDVLHNLANGDNVQSPYSTQEYPTRDGP